MWETCVEQDDIHEESFVVKMREYRSEFTEGLRARQRESLSLDRRARTILLRRV